MKHSVTYLIFLILFPLALGLSGCGAKGSAERNDSSLTLRTYTVPQGRAEDLSGTLNQVLGLGNYKHGVGRAWVAGPQQILVLAPTDMQGSIAASLKQILANDSDTAKSPPLRLNAWIVDAYPGHGPADPSLKTIQPALENFAEDMGPAHFVAAHYFTAVSDVGAQTDMRPLARYELIYTLTRSEGGLILKFGYSQPASANNGWVNSLKGQVTAQVGQSLVLGLVSDRPTNDSSVAHEGGREVNANAKSNVGSVHRLLVVRIAPANQG